jgi:AcrR family transcriptional regulator
MQMPARAKTTDAEIVAAARALVEQHGHEQVSLAEVASAVGIRAPSLYNRFADRATLLAAVDLEVWKELNGKLRASAARAGDPAGQLTAIARTYRSFAKAHPRLYALMWANPGDAGLEIRSETVGITLAPFAELVGKRNAFAAARVLAPFLHGFLTMELAGAFRMGPGVDEAFAHGVATILNGLMKKER